MNKVEQKAADTIISRMEFLEEIATLAQGHWNFTEYKVPLDSPDAIKNHTRLGELLKQNRDADSSPAPEKRRCSHCDHHAVVPFGDTWRCEICEEVGVDVALDADDSEQPPDTRRRTWWCPQCSAKSDDDGIVRDHKETCCHYGSALAPPATAAESGHKS